MSATVALASSQQLLVSPSRRLAGENERALQLVQLPSLMDRTSGRPEIRVGLIDGPVAIGDQELGAAQIVETAGAGGVCTLASSAACLHGTFVAGILVARRGSVAPAICPGCTLIVRPLFREAPPGVMPTARAAELAAAIGECVDAGAVVINVSATVSQASAGEARMIDMALARAARQGVIVVAAAGNQRAVGSSPLTRHPWVIPVASCDLAGVPLASSTLGPSIARAGLRAPGVGISSIGAGGGAVALQGTSVAAAVVTGTVALLWSLAPAASAASLRAGLVGQRRRDVVPPLLDADLAQRRLIDRATGDGT